MPPTFCPCNRPILKRPSAALAPPALGPQNDLLHIDPSVLGQPVVRFLPHDTLVTTTFLAEDDYDRSPIVVAPNACRLPERGCPGRTYEPSSSTRRARSPTPRKTREPLPPLVPDLTSSSDESDALPRFFGPNVHASPETSSLEPSLAEGASTLRPTACATAPVGKCIDTSLSISPAIPIPTPSAPDALSFTDSPPTSSPLSNSTSPVSFTLRSPTSSLLSLSPNRATRASRWERSHRRNGSRERDCERSREHCTASVSSTEPRKDRTRRSSRKGRIMESEEKFKRFDDFERERMLSSCTLRVADDGCFGGF